jgi:hypothetical protein
MTTTWLPGAKVVNLSSRRGNGPFTATRNFLGVILHVNESENGTSDSFFAEGPPGNPKYVTPNFQVYKDGSIHQYLPFNWQPWCQIAGNYHYAAIETAGLHSEALTEAQCRSIGHILAYYAREMHMALALANAPGQKGLGTHAMGGAAWGGHPCPGTIRAGQRQHLLNWAHAWLGDKPQRTHTVVAGDTLWDLAVYYYHDGNKDSLIASANHISLASTLRVGQVLIIP